jgi:hypothetical protein
MKKKRHMTPETVDIRGGELPMVVFRSTHAGFPVLKGTLDGLLKNWHDKGMVTEWDKTKTDFRY